MMREKTIFTEDMMSLEKLPAYGFSLQKQIADVSEIIFKIQQDKRRDKAVSMMKLMAQKLVVSGLSAFRREYSSISHARMIDRAAQADREAQKISEGLRELYMGLCKENMMLDTLKKLLEDSTDELEAAYDALEKHIDEMQLSSAHIQYRDFAQKRLKDLELSKTLAMQGMLLITELTVNNSTLAERINSLTVNTLVLWRADLAAMKSSPDKTKLERICGIEDVITAAIASI